MENNFLNDWYSLKWFSINQLQSYEWENELFLYTLFLLPIIYFLKKILSRRTTFQVSIPKSELSNFKFSILRFIPNIFFISALILIITSLSRPQKSNEKVERWSEGIDIMLVIDISESMQIEDFSPNRLESAKETAKNFIDGRFQDRIGLVVFSGESFTQCPLTTDHNVLVNLFKDVKSGMVDDGTALGMGIATVIESVN